MSVLGVHMKRMVLAHISVDDIRRANVFWLFLAFCNVFCIHELAKSASFFCNYVSSFFQVLADFCTPFCLSPRMQSTCHPDWTVSFKTLAVF